MGLAFIVTFCHLGIYSKKIKSAEDVLLVHVNQRCMELCKYLVVLLFKNGILGAGAQVSSTILGGCSAPTWKQPIQQLHSCPEVVWGWNPVGPS